MERTGYWAFFCNPQRYSIDKTLSQGDAFVAWQISKGQEGMFKVGDKGVIRVAVDKRTDVKRNLDPGVYAFCEVIGLPHLREKAEQFWVEKPQGYNERIVVDLKITNNLLSNPIHINTLKDHPLFNDRLFIFSGYGFYSAFPISKTNFELIQSLSVI